ncbi:hypothetical protein, partial [Erwinia amylovora]|uniref:hypothetical protein n=1 Tax=Erwinia amylovora TaxID=552 RepID=UPI0020C006B1
MAVTGVAQTAAALQAYYTQNGFMGQSEQKIADFFASMMASGAAITPSTVTASGAVTGLTG